MSTQEIRTFIAETKGLLKVHLSDGRKFEIKHMDFLQLHPVGDGMFLFNTDGSYIVINRHHITSLEPL